MSKLASCWKPFLAGISFLSVVVASLPASSSPSARTELICHTDDPLECYPRIFQPTKDFQVIRDGQDLPRGLHVRMNIWSGEKEARLNIPMEGEEDIEVEGAEQAIVVVPDPAAAEEEDQDSTRQVPLNAPIYEAAGKIQPPREDDNSFEDADVFHRSMKVLESLDGDSQVGQLEMAIEELSDLAHDIYYGVELLKSQRALRSIMTIFNSDINDRQYTSTLRHQAASLLGHSLQNNPSALKEMKGHWSDNAQSKYLFDIILSTLDKESEPATIKAKLYAINGLVKDIQYREAFVQCDGANHLLKLFKNFDRKWDGVRVRIAQLLMDNFLDEEMGAISGLWPVETMLDSSICELPDHASSDGCWEYHLGKEQLTGQKFDENMKREFLRLLSIGRQAVVNNARIRAKEL